MSAKATSGKGVEKRAAVLGAFALYLDLINVFLGLLRFEDDG